jgi:hypothetical protein
MRAQKRKKNRIAGNAALPTGLVNCARFNAGEYPNRFKLQIKSSNIQTLLASGSNKTIGLIADPTNDLIILVQH